VFQSCLRLRESVAECLYSKNGRKVSEVDIAGDFGSLLSADSLEPVRCLEKRTPGLGLAVLTPRRPAAMDSHIDRLGTPGIILGKPCEILRKPDLPAALSRYEQKPYKTIV
jgi:hypothetical protein